MNILLINGSPKGKGSNTYKLATAFINGLKSDCEKQCAIEEVHVNKLDLQPCLGCFACWNKTPGKCVINDDMKSVNEVNAIIDIAKFNSNVIDEFECFKSCAELLKQKYPNEYNDVFLASMKDNNGGIERYNNILHTKKVKIELDTIDINNNDKYIYLPRRIVTFKRNNMNIDVST